MTREERNKFVEENLGLVHYWLKKYQDYPNYEDLFGYGVLGMIDALDRMKGDIINRGYLKMYVTGYVKNCSGRCENNMYKICPKKGVYEKIDCYSIDKPIEEADSDCFGDLIPDEKQFFDDVITACDFERELERVCNKHKTEMLMFLDGYEKTEISKKIGISYEALRQQILKLDKKNFS